MSWLHRRALCVECGNAYTRRAMRQFATSQFVCKDCAIRWFYPDFLPSLFEWVYGVDFNA